MRPLADEVAAPSLASPYPKIGPGAPRAPACPTYAHRTMKIALISPLRSPLAEPFASGVERHTHTVATELTRRGHDVTLFGRQGSGPGLNVRAFEPSRFAEAGEADAPQYREAQLERAYAAVCDAVAGADYDVVHDHSQHYVPLLVSGRLPGRVVHVLYGAPAGRLGEAASIAGETSAASFVAVSDAARRAWAQYVPNCQVVHPGLDLMRWRYSSRPVPNLVSYIGRIAPERGVHHAIDAARRAGKQCLVAGSIEDEAYYRDQVEPRLDEERRYVGSLDSLSCAQLLSNSECSLFTALRGEPFGLALAESLACGTPVAGFRVGPAEELLDESSGALCAPGDTGALAAAIGEATGLERRYCRRLAQERYTLEGMVDAYERVYAGRTADAGIGAPGRGPGLGAGAYYTARSAA